MIARTFVLTLLAAACAAPAARAQTQPEPAAPAQLQLGPVSVRPQMVLREVGYDSNVFNASDEPEGDFTATVGAKVDVGVRLPALQATYSSLFEYAYFESFESERGTNRGAEGRADLLLGRLTPYVAAGIGNSHDRPTSEIDARAQRQMTHVEAGLRAALFSRTSVSAGFRRTGVEYSGDEIFRGVSLADALNSTGRTITLAGEIVLTPLTTLSVHGDRAEDRFEFSPERDADSYRAGATVSLHPLALISGKATIGVRAFRPVHDAMPEFTGVTAAVSVGYSLRASTRLNLAVDRDLRYSFDDRTPYYVATGARLTVTQQLFGNVDGQAFGGVERIAYEARIDAPVDAASDRVRVLGGGIGYRLGDGARLGLNLDHWTRRSPQHDREYARTRIYTSLSYGF